jgi:hypothetical protein
VFFEERSHSGIGRPGQTCIVWRIGLDIIIEVVIKFEDFCSALEFSSSLGAHPVSIANFAEVRGRVSAALNILNIHAIAEAGR